MKISEVVQKLLEIQKQQGDVDVVVHPTRDVPTTQITCDTHDGDGFCNPYNLTKYIVKIS